MQINVLPELRKRVGCVATYDIAEAAMHLQDLVLADFAGTVRLLRTDRGLLVSIEATAKIDETCSRCLTEARCTVNIAFAEVYVPMFDATTGAHVQIDETEEIFRIGPDFVLDLREGLRQYVLMAEPAQPLCRPDCAGLCPTCGADLNGTSCRCTSERDARWGALATLNKEIAEGS